MVFIQRFRFLLALVFSASMGTALFAQRQAIPLAAGWKFIRSDVGVAAQANEKWRTVNVPHSWNIVELPADSPDGKYRGAGWYEHAIPLPDTAKGNRVFIRFEAAAIVADVYLNGHHLGQHRGAFGAFCFELTPWLRDTGDNVLRVRVDNSPFQDVAPLEGDFTMHGGLYRPVTLLIADPVCISPLDHASSGVYLTVKNLASKEAVIQAKTLISSGLDRASRVQVETEITDAGGRSVAIQQLEVDLVAGEQRALEQNVRIMNPHLWQGRRDPYLYRATIRLRRGGKVVDSISQPLGVRTIEITQDRGVLLNGEPYDVHGVNSHQDRQGKGWALSPADHDEDIRMILDMGCTGLRLAHYQQSDYVHELCDRGGLLVWQEVPLVNRISGLSQFSENARQQLAEMILQGYNHPALCFWGLFNELNATWANPQGPAPDGLITELRQLANQIDPTRPTVAASYMREPSALHTVPQWIAFNTYPGWYWGVPEDFGPLVTSLTGHLSGKRVGISEYGAGASVLQHQEGPLEPPKNTGTHFHPEEWQAVLHERLWAQMRQNPHLWGTFLWVMFDFSSESRNEGDSPARNDKGLVTADRKVKKDAFYFYQANWSETPMLHIASQRMTSRKQASTEVKVYSNCGEVELRVNGKSLGIVKPDDVRTFRWPSVRLGKGPNSIEAIGKCGGKELHDQCSWVLEGAGEAQ